MTDDYPWLTVWLTTLLAQTPTLLTLLASCAGVLAGWKRLGPAAPWALLGFGLLLVRLLLASSTQILFLYWTQHDHVGVKEVGLRTMIFSGGLSCLEALSLILIAIAVFAGRQGMAASAPPPLPTQNLDANFPEPRI